MSGYTAAAQSGQRTVNRLDKFVTLRKEFLIRPAPVIKIQIWVCNRVTLSAHIVGTALS